jgi:transcriptional regulator with XRE-family HTH domain
MTRVKCERLKRGWSLQALGYRAGIQAGEVSKIERRLAVPYPKQLKSLARVLGVGEAALLEEVTPDELLDMSRV